jgi:hypothetical protein
MAEIELRRNHPADAKKHLFAAVNIMKDLKSPSLWFSSTFTVAQLALGQQKIKQATIFFGWADSFYKFNKIILKPIDQTEFDRHLAQTRAQLTQSEFQAAWAEGQAMSKEQVLALALEILQ